MIIAFSRAFALLNRQNNLRMNCNEIVANSRALALLSA